MHARLTNAITSIATAVALAVAVVAALLVCTVDTSAAATVENSIQDYAYNPADQTVSIGDTVKWTNNDRAPHTVTSTERGGPLDSPNMQTGDTWSHTFSIAGEFPYYCAIHPDMLGKVTVVAASSEPPPSTTTSTTAVNHEGGHGSPTTTTTTPPEEPAKQPEDAGSCDGLVEAMLTPFVVHFNAAHLETGPGQQASEATDVDQYAKTHTVMLKAMWMPLVNLVFEGPTGLDAFFVHFYAAHLETGPGQQASDAANVDQYAKTHTVMLGDMAAPSVAATTGSC